MGKRRWVAYPLTLLVVIVSLARGFSSPWEMLLPGPLPVFARAGEEIGRNLFWGHLGASAWRILAGDFCASLIAIPLGLILATSQRLDRMFAPLIYLSYPIPKYRSHADHPSPLRTGRREQNRSRSVHHLLSAPDHHPRFRP